MSFPLSDQQQTTGGAEQPRGSVYIRGGRLYTVIFTYAAASTNQRNNMEIICQFVDAISL